MNWKELLDSTEEELNDILCDDEVMAEFYDDLVEYEYAS